MRALVIFFAFFVPAVLHANPLQLAPLAACLKGWDVKWSLPYYPGFQLDSCGEESKAPSDSTLFTGAAARSRKVQLRYRTEWFPATAASGDAEKAQTRRRVERARMAFQHFDRLLTGQQWKRVDGPHETDGPPEKRMPSHAVYEKTTSGGTLRIELRSAYDDFEIVLNERGTLRPDVGLPAPTNDFDVTEPRINARLFAIPGVKLEKETVSHEEAEVSVPVELRRFTDGETKVTRWVPVRHYRFAYNRVVPAAELESAYRELLMQAGWKPARDTVMRNSNEAFRYALGNRSLEVGIRVVQEPRQPPVADILLADATIWPPLVRLLYTDRRAIWETRPQFAADGRPTLATRAEIFELAEQLDFRREESGVVVVPIANKDLLNDAAATKEARAAASWVAQELIRRGVAGGKVKTVDEVRPTEYYDRFLASVGARASSFSCRNVSDIRPKAGEARCECRGLDKTLVSDTSGTCR